MEAVYRKATERETMGTEEARTAEAHHEARREAARTGRMVRLPGHVFHPPVTPEKRAERGRLARAFMSSPIGGDAA